MRRSIRTTAGSWVALPTPFKAGVIDFVCLSNLIELQVQAGSDGLVIAGTTGEAATLSRDERRSLVEFTANTLRGRLPLLAGVGTSNTQQTCTLAHDAESCGADGLLVCTPPYSRPSQAGLAAHFARVAQSTRLPLVLYNIPRRTGVDLLPATVVQIAGAHSNILAIKEASGDLERVSELVEHSGIEVLCGEDQQIADCILLGAKGVIGVIANILPQQVTQLVACLSPGGERADAPALVESLQPLLNCLFLESNPAPLKAALALLGLARNELRAPLVPVTEAHHLRIEKALTETGLVLS